MVIISNFSRLYLILALTKSKLGLQSMLLLPLLIWFPKYYIWLCNIEKFYCIDACDDCILSKLVDIFYVNNFYVFPGNEATNAILFYKYLAIYFK